MSEHQQLGYSAGPFEPACDRSGVARWLRSHAAVALIGIAGTLSALGVTAVAQAEPFVAPRTPEALAEFEVLADKQSRPGAKPRTVDELRWVFDLYSGHHRAHTPEWEWNPLFDKVTEDPARALKLRAQIFEACEDVNTLGCGGEFVFGYVDRSGMFHIKLLPDSRSAETDPRFILSFPTGRATFKIIDLKPFGTRMPSFNEMDAVPAMRRAGFLCQVQSVDRKDAIDPKLAPTVRRLRAHYQKERKVAPDYDVQCKTPAGKFFPVYSKTGEDLQLLGGHISPRDSKLQFENPVLLITPDALFFSARKDKSRAHDNDAAE